MLFPSTEDVSGSPVVALETADICRRLEERIRSLTAMGDNLQRENKGTYKWGAVGKVLPLMNSFYKTEAAIRTFFFSHISLCVMLLYLSVMNPYFSNSVLLLSH